MQDPDNIFDDIYTMFRWCKTGGSNPLHMSNDVEFSELVNAYHKWRALTHSPRNKNSALRFFKFLGCDGKIMEDVYASRKVPPNVIDRIRWLNGPNAKTLYKVWRARHG